MRSKKEVSRTKIGLSVAVAGLLLYLSPFVVVVVDNALGVNRPGDLLIGKFGLLIITIGPILVIAGLLIALLMKLGRPKNPKSNS